ncbi:MAG: hypothetical protein JW810_02545, partial [Sedimentisphaerales bacterium]|nr:hypothetical protein [Sedimentisphaerales bacterium]
KALQLAQKRTPPPAGSDLRQKVMDLLRLESFRRRTEQPSERPSVPYRILPGRGNRDYPQRYAVTYAVETEPGIHAIVTLLRNESWQSRPPQGERRAILYIAHHSADAELREDPFLAELCRANPETPFYACDVRGIGESRPDTCQPDSFLHPYGSDYFYAIHSIMLDRPYLGQKTGDVLRVLDWLGEQGCRDVQLVGRGWGALPATFAALLSDRVSQVTLKNALTSFSAVATSETYAWPLSCLIPGVLEQFDLPDCYRELQAKKHLVLLEPWDENAEIVPSD